MIIYLSPQRRDDTLTVSKSGDVLVVNGETFDFSKVGEGDTLPLAAIKSMWFSGDVSRTDGELSLTLLFPNPWNYSPEQAFPVPLKEVPDGAIALPKPLPSDPPTEEQASLPNNSERMGVIDWSQLITASMKAEAEVAAHLQAMKTALAAKNSTAVTQISRIQDRIDTIGYGIEAGEATPEDEAEQAALMLSLKSWKAYKFALGKVTAQQSWHASPVWPVEPAIPEIEASPMSRTVDQV
ncbi:hypothetical protein A9HBioS_3424 [Pseudomonas koreensis]|uniref:Uncharacterized protein n=2 Tax=Pseudomonas koreensis TaxID=198620 RepID=A0AA94EMM5_9PSED|nr:hypothetical protein A9HBioS_3424 [Pseudomonas koreensis]